MRTSSFSSHHSPLRSVRTGFYRGTILIWTALLLALIGGSVAASPREDPVRLQGIEDNPGMFASRHSNNLEYSVSFQGIEDQKLLEDLEKASSLHNQAAPSLVSAFFLEKQAENDLSRLLETCFAHGYYRAEAEVRLSSGPESQYEVIYTFRPGPRYEIEKTRIEVQPTEAKQDISLPDPEKLGLSPGSPARAERILEGKARLQHALLSQGYLNTEQTKPEVIVEDASRSVRVVFHVYPGKRVRLGRVRILGLEGVKKQLVADKIAWTPGQTYDPQLIYRTKTGLMNTGLFNLIRIRLSDHPNARGLHPVTITVRERAPRSVRFGLGFESDIGALANAAWAHNNVLGSGETLSLTTGVSALEQDITGKLTIPRFFRIDQSLLLNTSLKLEDYESYENTALQTEMSLQRRLGPELNLNAGIGYKAQSTEDAEGSNQYHLLFFPGYLEWDTRDSLLNPSRGLHIGFGLTPYQSLFPADLTFVKTLFSARWYQALNTDKDFILALRTKWGSIGGASTGDIPADERLYAGGGGSIRGYPYQEVGPQKDGDPFGGRSLLEVSGELRWTVTDPFGAVLFLDGGQVTDDPLPDPGDQLAWGAGLGLRYATDLGPLRLDVAFPLNPDDHIHDDFQVYISIGQAF